MIRLLPESDVDPTIYNQIYISKFKEGCQMIYLMLGLLLGVVAIIASLIVLAEQDSKVAGDAKAGR